MREKEHVALPRAGRAPPVADPDRRHHPAPDRRRPRPDPFITWPRILEWGLIPVAFVVLRFVPPRPTRLSEWLLLLLAGTLFASPVVLASHREFAKRRQARSAEALAIEYQTRLGLTLGEAITPIGDLLGHIGEARGGDRKRLQGQLRQRVVDACSELCGGGRARGSFFELQDGVLRPVAWSGRAEAPRTVFVKGEPQGEAAHALVTSRRRLLVSDVRDPPENVFVRPDAPYRAFLSVPVYAGSRDFGMLSVDTEEPYSLEQSDLDIATALAQLLGAGLAIA